jgi:predicted RNA-binding Zn-ribbon protein involved in translation (DUF1610 family)
LRLRNEILDFAGVTPNPVKPQGVHRDEQKRPYCSITVANVTPVWTVLEKPEYKRQAVLLDDDSSTGSEFECANCGNIAGDVLPSICPNCGFKDITLCPSCAVEVPRQKYRRISGDLFHCPKCFTKVRLNFNAPMFLPDGSFHQPLEIVDLVRRDALAALPANIPQPLATI